MTPYVLQREQWIPQPIEEVFAFFADARNLEAITPPWLGFQILSPEPIVMAPGTLIEYQQFPAKRKMAENRLNRCLAS